MNIKPIRTDADHQDALEEIERLWDAEPGTPEGDRLEVLMTLVEAYEDEHHPIPLPDPIEAIKYYMESCNLSRQDLEPIIGGRARVSEILNRRRALSLRMIRNLEAELGIPAEILVQPYDLQPYDRADAEEEEVLHEQGVQVTPWLGRQPRYATRQPTQPVPPSHPGDRTYVWKMSSGFQGIDLDNTGAPRVD
jgi:HTH-type transcriptional regulator/antitoxin HigA